MSREKKHTKGPWVTDDSHKRYFGSVYSSDSLGSMIVRMPNMSHLMAQRSTEELEANANLISAAPELLEALEAIVDDDPTKANHHEARDMAEDAIKKAYGETE